MTLLRKLWTPFRKHRWHFLMHPTARNSDYWKCSQCGLIRFNPWAASPKRGCPGTPKTEGSET